MTIQLHNRIDTLLVRFFTVQRFMFGVWFALCANCAFACGCGPARIPFVGFGSLTVALQTVDASEALQRMPNTSWYDKQTEGFAPPKVTAEKDDSTRSNGWLGKPRAPDNWNWNWDLGLRWPAGLTEILSYLVYGLMALALITAIALLTYFALRGSMPGRFRKESTTKEIAIDPTRVVELPFEVQPVAGTPLQEAGRLRAAGNIDSAIVYLYGYMLLAIDQSRKIHLQKGKTNRMYLRELIDAPKLRSIAEGSMLAFEHVYFGKHHLDAAEFDAIWNQLDEFHRLLAESPVGNQALRMQAVAV